jgi:putative restriction endonuclease
MKDGAFWLGKMMALNPAIVAARGPGRERIAPHKALLLLSVLELADEGKLASEIVPFSPELVLRFNSYWRIVVARWTTRPNARMPFHHLATQGFWKAIEKNGNDSPHRNLTEAIRLDPSFFAAMRDPRFRREAKAVLIQRYFPPVERVALLALVGLDNQEAETVEAAVQDQAREQARITARNARFRIRVVSGYVFTCALTGYALTTITGASIVDAAHIHERKSSSNDDPENGLALCKNAHWMFDEGLWSIDDDFRVIVSRHAFTDSSLDGFSLRYFQNRPLIFHQTSTLRPHRKYLAWHRENRFVP